MSEYLVSYVVGCGSHPFRPMYNTVFKFKAIRKAKQLEKEGYLLVNIKFHDKEIDWK